MCVRVCIHACEYFSEIFFFLNLIWRRCVFHKSLFKAWLAVEPFVTYWYKSFRIRWCFPSRNVNSTSKPAAGHIFFRSYGSLRITEFMMRGLKSFDSNLFIARKAYICHIDVRISLLKWANIREISWYFLLYYLCRRSVEKICQSLWFSFLVRII